MVYRGGARADRSYATEEEARAVARDAARELGTLTTSVGAAVDDYLQDCARRRVRPITIGTYRDRLALLLEPVWGLPLTSLAPARAAALYQRLVGAVAVDTHRGALIVARTWASWCVGTGQLRSSPFARVRGVGRRRRGKPQLHLDEAHRLLDVALALSIQGQDGSRGRVRSTPCATTRECLMGPLRSTAGCIHRVGSGLAAAADLAMFARRKCPRTRDIRKKYPTVTPDDTPEATVPRHGGYLAAISPGT